MCVKAEPVFAIREAARMARETVETVRLALARHGQARVLDAAAERVGERGAHSLPPSVFCHRTLAFAGRGLNDMDQRTHSHITDLTWPRV